jgi:hypothetical protein
MAGSLIGVSLAYTPGVVFLVLNHLLNRACHCSHNPLEKIKSFLSPAIAQ